MRRILIAALALLAFAPAARAQKHSPVPDIIAGTLNLGTGTTVQAGAVNVISAGGYQINASAVLNTLGNTTSPILSPETQNTPSSFALYTGAPLVQGWNDTWSATSGNGIYSQMITDNVTVANGTSVHYGMEESTLNVLGTGTSSNEWNVEKMFLYVNPGVINTGFVESFEPAVQNEGTLATVGGIRGSVSNGTSGTITSAAINYDISFSNYNTAAGSVFAYYGLLCEVITGSGSAVNAGRSYCLMNNDPTQEIATFGHVAYRASQSGALPTVTGCGTGASVTSTSSDMAGLITEGTSATGCTLSFAVQYSFAPPNCIISSPNGAPFTSYSATQNSLAIVNASASGNQYAYTCFATY